MSTSFTTGPHQNSNPKQAETIGALRRLFPGCWARLLEDDTVEFGSGYRSVIINIDGSLSEQPANQR